MVSSQMIKSGESWAQNVHFMLTQQTMQTGDKTRCWECTQVLKIQMKGACIRNIPSCLYVLGHFWENTVFEFWSIWKNQDWVRGDQKHVAVLREAQKDNSSYGFQEVWTGFLPWIPDSQSWIKRWIGMIVLAVVIFVCYAAMCGEAFCCTHKDSLEKVGLIWYVDVHK